MEYLGKQFISGIGRTLRSKEESAKPTDFGKARTFVDRKTYVGRARYEAPRVSSSVNTGARWRELKVGKDTDWNK